jgi:hypothetical protein
VCSAYEGERGVGSSRRSVRDVGRGTRMGARGGRGEGAGSAHVMQLAGLLYEGLLEGLLLAGLDTVPRLCIDIDPHHFFVYILTVVVGHL